MSKDLKTEFIALLGKRDEEIETLKHEVVHLKMFVNKVESIRLMKKVPPNCSEYRQTY